MVEWEDYITIETLTLLVGIATLVVTILSYKYNRRKDKMQIENLIASKEAQLHAIEMSLKAGFNVQEYGSLDMQVSSLRAEIEQLKKQV